jgi:hypothetical protein
MAPMISNQGKTEVLGGGAFEAEPTAHNLETTHVGVLSCTQICTSNLHPRLFHNQRTSINLSRNEKLYKAYRGIEASCHGSTLLTYNAVLVSEWRLIVLPGRWSHA